jgi:hypothetical protein
LHCVFPESLDYVTLAKTNSTPLIAAVKLSRYTCSRLPSGALEARVSGPDQSGFLARLLCRFVLLGLFLTEFDIDTQGDQIDDRFVLVCAGGVSPSPAVQQSLEDQSGEVYFNAYLAGEGTCGMEFLPSAHVP